MKTITYSLEQALDNADHVEIIYLNDINWKSFPTELLKLKKLRDINITNAPYLTELPDWLVDIPLTGISIRNAPIHQIKKLPTTLKEIDFMSLNISEFPENIGEITALKTLVIYACQLTKIPKEIKYLTEVEKIQLGKNQLTEIPKEIEAFSQAKYFDVGHNLLKTLPKEIERLSNVTYFTASNNQLTQIPDGFLNAPNLIRVNLNHNQLTKLPTIFKTVVDFQLENNQLTEIDNTIQEFHKLESLALNDNDISSISSNIHKIDIKRLWLSNNKLGDLSVLFEKENKLEVLKVADNLLTTVPPTIYQSNLTLLDITKNSIIGIPFHALFTPSIKTFQVDRDLIDENFLEKQYALGKACFKKKIESDFFEVIYHICIHQDKNPHNYPLSFFFRALTIPFQPLQTNALSYIRKNAPLKLGQHPLQQGSVVAVLGKTSFKKIEIKERLEKVGLNYNTKITSQTTHVVIEKGAPNYNGVDQEGLVYISDSDLQEFLTKVDTLYLNESTTSDEEIENVQALLVSKNDDSINVGLEMMSSLGVPEKLITELFIICKDPAIASKVRNKAKKLLLNYASTELKALMEQYNRAKIMTPLFHKSSNFKIPFIMKEFTKNTELDAIKIAQYVISNYGFYFITCYAFLLNDENRVKVLTWLIEEKRTSSIEVSYLNNPDNLFKLPLQFIEQLEYNNLRSNTLPKDLFTYKNLRKLNINYNSLDHIPADFSQLEALEYLDISGNNFTQFPTILVKMENLKTIKLLNNPFVEKPDDTIFDLSKYPDIITRK